MVLEKIYKYVRPLVDDLETIEFNKIYEQICLLDFNKNELVDKSDEEINKFIGQQDIEVKKKESLFKLIQKIKIEMSLEDMSATIGEENDINDKNKIIQYFNKFIELEEVEISDDKVKITFNFEQESNLRKKLNDVESRNKENIVDTISAKTKVSVDNIQFIENLSAYIEFISKFEEINYVSRGQKDCMYELVPSLHRIYNNGFKNHSSQLESDFRQKILYYDNSTMGKDAEELRAYAQHFGLPTNYLDFTEAHLISLLFAVEEFEYTENHSIVYFVDALAYNKETIRDEIKLVDFSNKNIKNTKEARYSDKSYFIRVGNSNERIHFQKGCFLKVEPNDSLDNMLQNYTKIAIIDRESKKDILKELFNLGITFENIYPDKDNMVKTIKFIRNHINQQ